MRFCQSCGRRLGKHQTRYCGKHPSPEDAARLRAMTALWAKYRRWKAAGIRAREG